MFIVVAIITGFSIGYFGAKIGRRYGVPTGIMMVLNACLAGGLIYLASPK